jgi:uncharacterized protein (DUF924 family)
MIAECRTWNRWSSGHWCIFEFFANQARLHREAIVRFGRHPQRNAILTRTSTSVEIDYVKALPERLRPRPTVGTSE